MSDLRTALHPGDDTINQLVENFGEPSAESILASFKKLGDKASYHYADDSTSEWHLADKAKAEALAIFDAHPELHEQMREIGLGFLWLLGMARPRKADAPTARDRETESAVDDALHNEAFPNG